MVVSNEADTNMLFKATNMEEAISKAEKHYKCGRKSLRVYTVKPPVSLLWGAIRRPGVYRVERRQLKQKEAASWPQSVDGTVEITDGAIKVKNPVNGGRYPSIIVKDPNIVVYINGKKVTGTCLVTEKDSIIIAQKHDEPVIHIDVEISPDEMEAVLTIKKTPGRKYYLRDVEACNSLFISGDYKEIPPPPVSLQQCIDKLTDEGVVPEFIQTEEVQRLLEQSYGGSRVVARGNSPVHGVNSSIKYYFSQTSYRNPKFDLDQQVDMMDHTIIPTVKVGDVLAEKLFPAIPGKDGMTVTGKVIKARPAREPVFKAGKGTILLDNIRIVATIPGRPLLRKGVVSVVPILTIPGDVNIDTGNIRFDGDVIVRGNVREGLKVVAGGDIIIGGNCYHAALHAGGNISVYGNIINCKVSAGADMIMHLFIIPAIEKITRILKTIVDKITTTYQSRYKQSIGNMVYTMINENKRFRKLVEDMERMLPLLEEEEAKLVTDVVDMTKKELFGTNALHIHTLNQIQGICSQLNKYKDFLNNRYIPVTDVTLRYCENSLIQSSGNITVTGRGSYRSKFIAKNQISFKKADSVVLGGILVAGKRIKAGVIGSNAGIATYCRILDANGKFKAVHCHSNTVLRVNEHVQTY